MADNRRENRYRSKQTSKEKKIPSEKSLAESKDGSARSTQSSGHQKSGVIKSIEALQHTMRPVVSIVSPELLHNDFRQFTQIFARNKAALSIVSCEPVGRSRNVLVAGEDCSIAQLNYETGHVMRRWVHAHQNDINKITKPVSSGLFATASRDRVVKVWNFSSDRAVAELEGHTLNVSSVDMHPDGNLLVSGSKDNTVRLWDISRGEELFCGDVKLNVVHFVEFMPEMRCVVQGGEDLAIRLWDVRTRGNQSDLELSKTIQEMDYYPVCCSVVPGQPYSVLVGHNGVNKCGGYVTQWDLRTGRRMCIYNGHSSTVSNIDFASPKMYGEGVFLTSSDDGTMGVWSVAEGGAATEVNLEKTQCFAIPEGRITSFETERNGDTVVTLDDGCLVVFRPDMMNDAVIPSLRFRYVGIMQRH